MIMKLRNIFMAIIAVAAIIPAVTSCSDSKSYAELLTDENHTVNHFLSLHRVVTEIPDDNKFEIGSWQDLRKNDLSINYTIFPAKCKVIFF